MRIVTGKYKGRRFDVPRTFKARPTTDFAKENLFNVLQGYFDFEEEGIAALDLFAGTGSITAELLSRGCSRVVSVERDRQHSAFISGVIRTLGADNCTLLCTDVLKLLARPWAGRANTAQGFNLIFADPPYAMPELPRLPELVMACEGLLAPGGLFVLEHGKDNSFTSNPHFLEHRHYGSVNFTFFRQS